MKNRTLHISHLIHPGTPSQPGCIGTADPAVWSHTLYLRGHAYSAVLKSDMINQTPSYSALTAHFRDHPEMWIRNANPITPPAFAG